MTESWIFASNQNCIDCQNLFKIFYLSWQPHLADHWSPQIQLLPLSFWSPQILFLSPSSPCKSSSTYLGVLWYSMTKFLSPYEGWCSHQSFAARFHSPWASALSNKKKKMFYKHVLHPLVLVYCISTICTSNISQQFVFANTALHSLVVLHWIMLDQWKDSITIFMTFNEFRIRVLHSSSLD